MGEHRDLLPALARAVERQVDRTLRQGLLQGYRTAEENALAVRGRIREAEQIRRRFGATLPVEAAYGEFTPTSPRTASCAPLSSDCCACPVCRVTYGAG
ncbi:MULTISPECIES: McrC family protein [Streptomyces]|uniref:Transposase n=2 Tax=Streptomyces TaxID=1883 RepID=A0ABN1T0H6_9ACTN|nr:McrC family protein [Streptomyces sp. F-3]